MTRSTTLVWFRNDLRLADHPALSHAAQLGHVVPVFIWSPAEEAPWQPGAAARWWLHQSLAALAGDLAKQGSRLIVRQGESLATLRQMAHETGASRIAWNRRYEPQAMARDQQIEQALADAGITVETFASALLFEPWKILNGAGKPYQVFTPFWRACLAQPEPVEPVARPKSLSAPAMWPTSLDLTDLKLEPIPDWADGIRAAWQPGESTAQKDLNTYCETAAFEYEERRDFPESVNTSRLSPRLHWGELSPRQIWHALDSAARNRSRQQNRRSVDAYLRQLIWREFAHQLLFHFPHTDQQPLRKEFENFPWQENSEHLNAWQRGQTGYPIVDAGMRELWSTGWMHNRVRLVVASFLIKDLLIPWQRGAAWFWDTLVDANLANNTMGWQWTAGSGADAAPYFRIFNPVSQGERFDPRGNYVRRWVPEIAALPDKWLHRPWEAPAEILSSANITLDKSYPAPIVDHAEARQKALAALTKIRKRP